MASLTSSIDRIIVGVDFGTTFSGVAFEYVAGGGGSEDIDIIKSWPGGSNITSDKVPSEIAFDRTSGAVTWGYQLKPENSRIRCVKLLLDQNQTLPSWVSSETLFTQLEQSGKTPVRAAADFLSQIHKCAKDELEKRFGEQMMSSTAIEFILTVPAVWSDTAKNATLRAADMAGMGQGLRLISEPEAAAVYALTSMQHNSLTVGDVYILCDAGGGTVDLISYEIEQLSPLRLREVVPGNGFLCGGAFLNLRFEELVKHRLGAEVFQGLRERKPKAWEIALKYFEEYVKRTFDPSDDKNTYDSSDFNVPFPGVPDNEAARVDCGFLALSTAEVAEIFRPVVNEIIALVEQQRVDATKAGKTAKGVILVGGFGQSMYLYKSLKGRFAGLHPPSTYHDLPPPYTASPKKTNSAFSRDDPTSSKLLIMQPANAWTAVVRGAVLRGVEGAEIVSSRKARRHYGTMFTCLYKPDKHSLMNRQWDHFRERFKANAQLSWFIEKGETVNSGVPVLVKFHTLKVCTSETQELALFVCDEDIAPTESTNETAASLRVLCKLHVDLGKIPFDAWAKKHNDSGLEYFQLAHDIGMQIESGRLGFDLRVNGIVYGSVNADFD